MLNSKCLNLEIKNGLMMEQSQMICNMLWLDMKNTNYRLWITKLNFRLKQLNWMMLATLNSQMTLEFNMLWLRSQDYFNVM